MLRLLFKRKKASQKQVLEMLLGLARLELATNGLRSKLALLNKFRCRDPHNLAINRSYDGGISLDCKVNRSLTSALHGIVGSSDIRI
jgi:hypothetical protein